MIFRTSLSSVFGFLLSSSTKCTSQKDRDKILEKMAISVDKEKAITEECKGNTVQVMVALLISIISALVMLGAYTFGFVNDLLIISQFRDLMSTSLGFLLGEAKIKSKS